MPEVRVENQVYSSRLFKTGMERLNMEDRSVNGIIIGNNVVSGGSIVINNGKVFVDGKNVDFLYDERIINITVKGDLDSIRVDSCHEVKIEGNVGEDVHVSQGRVTIGGGVGRDVHVSQGNVDCGKVEGKVSVSMGNITSRKG
jgi:hypothetical protein